QISSWNLRDKHMVETIEALMAHLDKRLGRTKVVVWAHNSHLGDARATEMGARGEWNVGELLRERHPGEVFNVGFSSHTGAVTCAHNWDDPPEVKQVRPSMAGSYERIFHEVGLPRFLLIMNEAPRSARFLSEP